MPHGRYHILYVQFEHLYVIQADANVSKSIKWSMLFFFSLYSPVWAAARSSSARVSSPGVPSPRGPPEAAAGTAGEPAKRERGGSAEWEREAGWGEEKKWAEGRGELPQKSAAPIGVCNIAFYFILCHLGSEAPGTLWAAGEAARGPKRRIEKDFLGSRSLYYHHSALLPQGSQLE